MPSSRGTSHSGCRSRKLAPALLAGCSVVLKPPEETPLFGFLLAEVFADAGLPAYFVQPTIFAGVDSTMTIARKEIFGPVVAVISYDDEDHAIAIANDYDYGLSGSVWGPDVEHAKELARRIRSGNVAINQHTLDLGGPFGGFKQSGLGREYGLEGIEEYVEVQSIPYVREPVQR